MILVQGKSENMATNGLEKTSVRYEMQCLELKESFNVACIETACAFSLCGVRILPVMYKMGV